MKRRLSRCAAVVAACLLALALVGAPSGADETGVDGHVGSLVELSLQRNAPDRLTATITATVGPTEVSVSQAGRQPRVLGSYGRPMTKKKVTVHATGRRRGVTEQTVTFGPQGP